LRRDGLGDDKVDAGEKQQRIRVYRHGDQRHRPARQRRSSRPARRGPKPKKRSRKKA
jgi:hypothetical protein